jgi:hypothetical protein
MTFNNSLLDKIKKTDIVSYPFPHLIIKNPLSKEYYNNLDKEFPNNDLFLENKKYFENHRYNIFNHDSKKVHILWRNFLNLHSSKFFSDQLINLFADDLKKLYPKFFEEYNENKYIFGSSHKDFKEKKINLCMSADLAINTPITKIVNTVRSPHLDNPKKIITGLFYMRNSKDNSSGGDLEIFKFKNNKIKYYGSAVPKKYVDVITSVPYEDNIMIIFINTPYSIHGVTDRSPSKYSRRFSYFSLSSQNFIAHDTSGNQINFFEQFILRGRRKLKAIF